MTREERIKLVDKHIKLTEKELQKIDTTWLTTSAYVGLVIALELYEIMMLLYETKEQILKL